MITVLQPGEHRRKHTYRQRHKGRMGVKKGAQNAGCTDFSSFVFSKSDRLMVMHALVLSDAVAGDEKPMIETTKRSEYARLRHTWHHTTVHVWCCSGEHQPYLLSSDMSDAALPAAVVGVSPSSSP